MDTADQNWTRHYCGEKFITNGNSSNQRRKHYLMVDARQTAAHANPQDLSSTDAGSGGKQSFRGFRGF